MPSSRAKHSARGLSPHQLIRELEPLTHPDAKASDLERALAAISQARSRGAISRDKAATLESLSKVLMEGHRLAEDERRRANDREFENLLRMLADPEAAKLLSFTKYKVASHH
jgi:hypothetical protein